MTLAKLIEAFRAKLVRKFTESVWQTFSGGNKFVLSLAFARPVELAHTQFNASGPP